MPRIRLAPRLHVAALGLSVTVLLTACGVKEDTLHERLAPVERQTEELQADQQELQQRLAASEAEMQRLRAELDALRPQPKVKKGKTSPQPAMASAKQTPPTGMVVPPPKVVSPAEAAAEDRRLQTPAAATVPPTVPPTATVSPTATPPIASGTITVTAPGTKPVGTPPAPAARPTNEQEAYRQALATYEKGRFAEAEQLFDSYLQTWPSGKLAPNALYWKGECLYSKGRNADAVFVFKDVLTRFPRHPKAPDALLKSIMSYRHLGDADNARLHFSVLQEDYPNSSALKRARELGLDR